MEDKFGVDKHMGPVSEALKKITKYGSPEFISVYNRAFEAVQAAIIEALIPKPIETAPKDGTYVILLAPSGYRTTPWRAEVGHWDAEYRPFSPWQTHSNDSFTDGGEPPTHWLPLPSKEVF